MSPQQSGSRVGFTVPNRVCLFVYERSASSASALPLTTVWICCPYHGVIPSTQSWTGGSQAWGGRQARAVLIIFIIIATSVAVVRRILTTASEGRGFLPLVRRLAHFPYSISVGHTSLTSVASRRPCPQRHSADVLGVAESLPQLMVAQNFLCISFASFSLHSFSFSINKC